MRYFFFTVYYYPLSLDSISILHHHSAAPSQLPVSKTRFEYTDQTPFLLQTKTNP